MFIVSTWTKDSIVFNGIELLAAPTRFSVYRAPTDNDRNIRRAWNGSFLHLAKEKLYSCRVLEVNRKYVTLLASYSAAAPSFTAALQGKASITSNFKPCGARMPCSRPKNRKSARRGEKPRRALFICRGQEFFSCPRLPYFFLTNGAKWCKIVL